MLSDPWLVRVVYFLSGFVWGVVLQAILDKRWRRRRWMSHGPLKWRDRKMRAFLLGLVALTSTAQLAWGQGVCNPDCANQPTKCCAQPEADTFLAEECTSASSTATGLHFVLIDETGQKQFGLVEESMPAQFTVTGQTVTTALGNSGSFSVTIGESVQTARFQVVDAINPLHFVGQCVTTKGDSFAGLVFPAMLVVQNRALLVSGRNPFYCKTGSVDLLCFQVKGQVGGPFVAGELCAPDRVEYACGEVQ